MPAVQFTQKHLETLALAIRPSTRLYALEGAVRSSKTVCAIQMFYLRVASSNQSLHLISGKDYDTIKNNLLEGNGMGLLAQYPATCRLAKDKVGGYYIRFKQHGKKLKKILLVGYDKENSWKKILGTTIGVALVDEVNTASKQFIDELFSRQTSADNPFTIFTLNGDDPEHWCYTEYINKCKMLWKVPPSIVEDMCKVEDKKGWYYSHWTMNDNPIMTPAKIADAASIYPVGSYYYSIKIQGIRGRAEGSIFAQYMNDENIYFDYESIERNEEKKRDFYNKQISYSFGLDLGNGDIKRGTVLSLSIIGYAHETVSVIEAYSCKSTETNKLVNEICDKLEEWYDKLPFAYEKISSVWIDSYGAIQLMLETLRTEIQKRKLVIKCQPCMKFGDEDGRRARLEMMMMLIGQKRLKVSNNRNGQDFVRSLKKLVYDEKDALPLDNNQLEMDYYDSVCYSLTPYIRKITRKK